jgi:hypothetical protein
MDPTNTNANPFFAPCGAGASCITSGLGVSGTTNCIGAGTGIGNVACTSASDCAPGLGCINGYCNRYCQTVADCAGYNCPLCDTSTAPIQVGTASGIVTYGQCWATVCEQPSH